MMSRRALQLLFVLILISMLAVTSWASLQQPLWEWGGLTTPPDNAWTIATLFDTYFGFLTFFVWVAYKERGAVARVAWFVAIMLTGNMAMAVYMLRELARLAPAEPFAVLLTRRNG
jgi:hypothetical protein